MADDRPVPADADRAALDEAMADLDAGAGDVLEHLRVRRHDGVTYFALEDHRRGLEKGTVVVDGEVARGYPSIPRTLVVDPGFPAHFDGPAAVEEKLDGYNVRVVDLPAFDGPVALTRGGYVCPWTTDRARELLAPGAFFDANPDRMLCGEVVGPENPYTPHDYPVDRNGLFVFDVRGRTTGEPLPVDERRERCDAHGFPQPRLFGTAAPVELPGLVRDAVAELAAAGREGVVAKGVAGRPALKYTTGQANRGDLRAAFALPYDYGRDFLFPRVVREGFQAVEFDEDGEALRARAHELGEAILEPMVEAVRAVEAGGTLGEDHAVRGDPATVDALLAHLEDQGLHVDVRADERDDGERYVEFRKRAAASTDKIRTYLEGTTITE